MKEKRQANFELLRIVAMLMVIALHYLNKGDLLAAGTADRTAVSYATHLMEAVCIVAVNCYVLLSGYFLVESVWKPGRIVSLAAQILFYSILVPVVLLCLGVIPAGELSVYDWLNYVLPVETEHYWFATAYLLLYVFAPFLAAGVCNMEKRTLQIILAVLGCYFTVWKSIVPATLATDRYGYDYGWFLFLFLTAAYLRKYGLPALERKRNALLLYVGAFLGIFLLTAVTDLLAEKAAFLVYYKDMPTTYNHILCLAGAVGLFMVFKDMTIPEGGGAALIRRLAPYTFGVYLLHEHALVRYRWMQWLKIDVVKGSWWFVPHMIGCVLLVYGVGTGVDFVRGRLFDLIGGFYRRGSSKRAEGNLGSACSIYDKNRRIVENFLFPLLLILYPLAGIRQGIDVSDTTYSLANFQYFTSMEGTWIVATFLANVAGRCLMALPFGGTLMGMYFYTALIQSGMAVAVYRALKRKMPAFLVFLGEGIALGLCWCPSVILYNYLTYLLMTAGILLLYAGILQENREQSSGDETSDGGKKERTARYYVLAGICLGANVAVRMPNVTQAAFIVAVWYGVLLGGGENKGQRVLRATVWCLLGYVAGFGIPFGVICARYGFNAYPSMVQTMFAMTQKAVDYQPVSMVTGMMGDYLVGLYWLVFAGICMAGGWALFYLQDRYFAENRFMVNLCRGVYGAVLLLLLRFYWGRGMFSFRYYEYGSMYYPAVLLLTVTVLTAVLCLCKKAAPFGGKIAALLVLIQIVVTPLGSNNALYPIINNLFVAAPFVLWAGCFWMAKRRTQSAVPGHTRAGRLRRIVGLPVLFLTGLVFVQSVGFHMHFSFQDGIEGEKRDTLVSVPEKVQGIYTSQDNAAWLSELAEYVENAGLTGQPVLLYGEIPGLGYLLDMPPALSTFWPDLDSYLMAEYERDLAQMEAPPVIITASPVAAYLAEDADGMNWFGVDKEKLDADEKLQILADYMRQQDYRETFGNGRYVVYLPSGDQI